MGKLLAILLRGGPTKSKVAAPANVTVIVGIILMVAELLENLGVIPPGLKALLEGMDLNGLVVAIVGLVMGIIGYVKTERVA